MPMYSFECEETGEVIDLPFSVAERPKEVIKDGKKFVRSFRSERPGIPSSPGWPLTCTASGVHPSQAGELREFLRKSGCPTEVTKDGNPVYTSAAHRKKALKVRGMHDRASFY